MRIFACLLVALVLGVANLFGQISTDSVRPYFGEVELYGTFDVPGVNVDSAGFLVTKGGVTKFELGSYDQNTKVVSLSYCLNPGSSVSFKTRIRTTAGGTSLAPTSLTGASLNLPDSLDGPVFYQNTPGADDTLEFCHNAVSHAVVDSFVFYIPAGDSVFLNRLSLKLTGNCQQIDSVEVLRGNTNICYLSNPNANGMDLYLSSNVFTVKTSLRLRVTFTNTQSLGTIEGDSYEVIRNGTNQVLNWFTCAKETTNVKINYCGNPMGMTFVGPTTLLVGDTLVIGYNATNTNSLTIDGVSYPVSGGYPYVGGACVKNDQVEFITTNIVGQKDTFYRAITVTQRYTVAAGSPGVTGYTTTVTTSALPLGGEYIIGPMGNIPLTFNQVGANYVANVSVSGLSPQTAYTIQLVYNVDGINSTTCSSQSGLVRNFSTLACATVHGAATSQVVGNDLIVKVYAIGNGMGANSYTFLWALYEDGITKMYNFNGTGGTQISADTTLLEVITYSNYNAVKPYDLDLTINQPTNCGGTAFNGIINLVPWTTGVEELSQNDFIIYPNPTTANVNIQTENLEYWTIYSSDGRVTVTGTQATVSFEELPNGVYTIEVTANGRTGCSSIIKQ